MKRGLIFSVVFVVIAATASFSRAEAIPKDALYTIYCRSFSGDMRAQEATVVRDRLSSGDLKQWHVMHQEGESTLYYGFYKTYGDDSKDAKRAESDLKKIRSLVDADDHRVFPLAMVLPIPQPGGDGPPEMNLLNAPADRYWTLLIGVYADNPERKQAAVAAAQALRDSGVEAYYFHDSSASIVCVGAWPRTAIKEQESDSASMPVADKDVEMMVYNVPLPDSVPREFLTPEGKRVRVFAPKVDVQDPTMEAAMDKNPYFMNNGVVLGRELKDAKTGKKQVVPNHSALLIIPRQDKPQQETLPPEVAKRLMPTAQPKPKPGTGTLRRLDD